MATEVKHRRLRWLGHMLRMKKRIPKKGLIKEREAKDRNSWRKRNDCIILNG